MSNSTARRTLTWMALCVFALGNLMGCAPQVRTVREQQPVELPAGAAKGSCEERSWLEIVPSRTFARNMQSTTTGGAFGTYSVYTETASREQKGLAVYEQGGREPILVQDLFPRIDEPLLADQHMARIEGIQRDKRRSDAFATVAFPILGVGVAGTLASAGVLIAGVQTENDALSDAALYGTLGSTVIIIIGAALSIGHLLSRPPPNQVTYMQVRERMFIPTEDDIAALERGVQRANERRRKEGGGR